MPEYQLDPKGNPILVDYLFPGDLIIFTGKREEVGCGDPKATPLYLTTVVLLDPTHDRHPMLVTILTGEEIPPGTRATLVDFQDREPAFGIKNPCPIPEGYKLLKLAMTN